MLRLAGLLLLLCTSLAAAQSPQHLHYDRYEGTIARQPVVMNLYPSGTALKGSYYYSKVGSPIPIWPSYREDGRILTDSLLLVEHPYGDTASDLSQLRLRFLGDGNLIGVWVSSDGKRIEPVELHVAYPVGSIHLTHFGFTDSLAKAERRDGRISATSTISLVLAEGNDADLDRFVNASLAKYAGCHEGDDVRSCLKIKTAEYLKGSIEEMDTEILGTPDSELYQDWDGRYQYYSDISIGVMYNDHGLLVLNDEVSDYSGGAHESFAVSTHVLDLERKRELALKDVTSADSVELESALEKYFRIQYHLGKDQPLSDILFEDKLAAGDNFYLTDRGIGFVYSPYEVASRADGVVQVFVPYRTLKGKLAPWLVRRMKL